MESAAFEKSEIIYQYTRLNITQVSNLQLRFFYSASFLDASIFKNGVITLFRWFDPS